MRVGGYRVPAQTLTSFSLFLYLTILLRFILSCFPFLPMNLGPDPTSFLLCFKQPNQTVPCGYALS